MESLETVLQMVLPVEKESLLLCDTDLLLCKLAIQEFHLTDADDIYQNLRVNINSHSIFMELSVLQRFIYVYEFLLNINSISLEYKPLQKNLQ